jgi:hypothetical protein
VNTALLREKILSHSDVPTESLDRGCHVKAPLGSQAAGCLEITLAENSGVL